MLDLNALKDKLSEMQNEAEEKHFDEIDFDARMEELRSIFKDLTPLVDAFTGILPEEDVVEMSKSLEEANSCLDNMATELSKLKELREEQDAFFKANEVR